MNVERYSTPMAASVPFCPTCGAPAAWQPHAHGWGCDRCRQMLALQPAPVQAQPQAPHAAGGTACPRCGASAVFHAESRRWGCDRCRAFLDEMWPYNLKEKPADRRAKGVKMIVGGLALILLGAIITGATYQGAVDRGGGTYFIAYGPIVVGVMTLFRGLFNLG